MFNLCLRCNGLVEMKAWMRGAAAPSSARAQASMHLARDRLHRAEIGG
jgi:hypothetical protein